MSSLTSGFATEQKTASLINRVNGHLTVMSERLSDIVEAAQVGDKDASTAAAESYLMEATAISIAKAAEDILTIIRQLKEAWCIGQPRPVSQIYSQDGADSLQDINEFETALLDKFIHLVKTTDSLVQ